MTTQPLAQEVPPAASCSRQIHPEVHVSAHAKPEPAVLWITGFSSAGKTTVGRKVKLMLEEKGINAVFLDGDDLRGIFAGKWGFERGDRIELAHAYFRLCNTLAAQGVTVVISAVAMYNEIYSWVRTNVDRAVQIYLKVPGEERLARDKATKNVYQSMGDISKLYDEPTSPDIVIENYGDTSPDVSATLIINAYMGTIGKSGSDKGRTVHWNQYYKSANLVFDPSDFAVSVCKECGPSINLLEIGCGNGRDAVYFAHSGHRVTALDPSSEAINLCRSRHVHHALEFVNGNLPTVGSTFDPSYDAVYTRFCLHAMTEKEEIENLKMAYQILKRGGQIFIECRSINDPLARKGEVISPTERIHGHYRRFIIMDELKRRLEQTGFEIYHAVESDNLAVLGDDNPVVIRMYAKK